MGTIQANEKLHGIFFCSVELLTGWQMKWIERSFFGRKCQMRKKKERWFCYIMLLNHLLFWNHYYGDFLYIWKEQLNSTLTDYIHTTLYVKLVFLKYVFYLFSLVESQKPRETMEVCETVISYAAITITIFLRYQFVTRTEYTIVVL